MQKTTRREIIEFYLNNLLEMRKNNISDQEIYDKFLTYFKSEDYMCDYLYEENPKVYVETIEELMMIVKTLLVLK